MINADLNIVVDYQNKYSTVCLTSTGQLSNGSIFLFDKNGCPVQKSTINVVTGSNFITTSTGYLPFSYPLFAYGVDTTVGRTDSTGLYYGDFYTNWQLSAENDFANVLLAFEWAAASNYNIPVDRRNNMYLDTVALVTRGDAVLQGTIATVTSGSIITLSTDKMITAYSGKSLNHCLGYVLSGAATGSYFNVTSHTQGSNNIYTDSDLTSLSGQLVKIMPYRTITTYSGFNYTGEQGSKGNKGITTRFGFTEPLPTTLGSISYSTGYYSGYQMVYHPADPGDGSVIPFTYTGGIVTLTGDIYGRTLDRGDLLFYSPSGSLGVTNTGIILYVNTHAVPDQGTVAVTYWPYVKPDPLSTYKVQRYNYFELENTPKFDQDYQAMVVLDGLAGVYSKFLRTPSVTFDITANEYESTFGDVAESTNFHIGPLTLSNGQILTDAGPGIPYLHYTGSVSYGDPVSPSVTATREMHSTQDVNVAQNFNGSYCSGGVFTTTSAVGFTTAQTLQCNVTLRYGAAKAEKTVSIPVQPL